MSLENLTENKTKFNNINTILKESYGYRIDYSSNLKELISLCDKVMETSIRDNSLFLVYDKTYTKAKLIKEAAHIFLSEIAPGRMKKKKVKGVKGE